MITNYFRRRVALAIFKALAPGNPWAEACESCKGYPVDACNCNWDVRLRRWCRRNMK